jgi:hypothetical protein
MMTCEATSMTVLKPLNNGDDAGGTSAEPSYNTIKSLNGFHIKLLASVPHQSKLRCPSDAVPSQSF